MRPVSLRFRCFGPYMEEQFIDFEALEKSGLFLICGETGAGKTTILDAICYALYGKSSGGLRGDMSVMRCKLAEKEDETMVEFVFDAGQKRYKFTRSLRYGRKNLRDYHNCMVLEDGNYVPIFANPKKQNVSAKAEEIIGLNDEQFRQVVILPQGQFERFLVSDSAEKESILVSLFGADKWQKIAEEIYRRITEEDQKLIRERADIQSRLKDYSCENVEELQILAAQKEQELIRLQSLAERVEKETAEKKRRYEQAVLLNAEFEVLEKWQIKMEQLKAKAGKMEATAQRLAKSDIADQIQPLYAETVRAKEEYARRKNAQKSAEEEKIAAECRLQGIQNKQNKHEEMRVTYDRETKRLALLERAEGLYESLEQKKGVAENAEKEWNLLKKKLADKKQSFEQANVVWMEAMESQQKCMDAYSSAQKQYLDGISGTLAEKLIPGEPCPVCGSREHPKPARLSQKKVTEKELDTLNKKLNACTKAVSRNAELRRNAEAVYQNLQQEAGKAEQNMIALQTAYEELLGQKISGIENAMQLLKERKTSETWILSFREEEKQIQQLLTAVQGEVTAANVQLAKAQEASKEGKLRFEEQQTIWKQALSEHGFADEEEFIRSLMQTKEKNTCRETLISYRTTLENVRTEEQKQQEKLEGKIRPKLKEMEYELQIAETEQKNRSKELILAQQEVQRIKRIEDSLAKRKAKYEKERIRVDANLEFAGRLRGRSGISLQRYVLGVMLSSVTVEANRLLKQVHGGRYRLYRTNEIAGTSHKGGLELEVLDALSGERRSVTTLSGGEKFLVALSLAIGLSTIVQTQGNGMRLGAMFVDEGFGTLDQHSVYDALEVLQGIQKANGLVGIISHVEMLKDVIPVKLEILKGKNGSYISIIPDIIQPPIAPHSFTSSI